MEGYKMNYSEERQIIKLSEMKPTNHKLDDPNVISIELPKRVKVRLEDVSFRENIVNRIEVYRFDSERGSSLFVDLYMGNIELANFITETDITVCKNYREDFYGENQLESVYVREARDHDYACTDENDI